MASKVNQYFKRGDIYIRFSLVKRRREEKAKILDTTVIERDYQERATKLFKRSSNAHDGEKLSAKSLLKLEANSNCEIIPFF